MAVPNLSASAGSSSGPANSQGGAAGTGDFNFGGRGGVTTSAGGGISPVLWGVGGLAVGFLLCLLVRRR